MRPQRLCERAQLPGGLAPGRGQQLTHPVGQHAPGTQPRGVQVAGISAPGVGRVQLGAPRTPHCRRSCALRRYAPRRRYRTHGIPPTAAVAGVAQRPDRPRRRYADRVPLTAQMRDERLALGRRPLPRAQPGELPQPVNQPQPRRDRLRLQKPRCLLTRPPLLHRLEHRGRRVEMNNVGQQQQPGGAGGQRTRTTCCIRCINDASTAKPEAQPGAATAAPPHCSPTTRALSVLRTERSVASNAIQPVSWGCAGSNPAPGTTKPLVNRLRPGPQPVVRRARPR